MAFSQRGSKHNSAPLRASGIKPAPGVETLGTESVSASLLNIPFADQSKVRLRVQSTDPEP